MLFELATQHDAALGNGTRKRGAVLATIETPDGVEHLADVSAAILAGESDVPGVVTLSEGVTLAEVANLLRNPHLCDVAPVGDHEPTVSDTPAETTNTPDEHDTEPDDDTSAGDDELVGLGLDKRTADKLRDEGIGTKAAILAHVGGARGSDAVALLVDLPGVGTKKAERLAATLGLTE